MASDTMRPPAAPAYPKWAEPAVVPIARLISMAVDTMHLAERTAGPALDLFIRVWLAESFLASGLVKAANWQTALLLATYEHPCLCACPCARLRKGIQNRILTFGADH